MAELEQQQAAFKDTASTGSSDVSLKGWSTRVEDLLDKNDEDGAVNLLESVIAKLSTEENAVNSGLALAAAMSDLGRLYASRGMSLKADQLLSDALLVKNKAEEGAASEGDRLSWEDEAEQVTASIVGVRSLKKPGFSHDRVTEYDRLHVAETSSSTVSINAEEDWESAVPTLLASPPVRLPSVVDHEPEKVKAMEVPIQKQRGRGAFTYGRGGNLYSDLAVEEGAANERLNQTGTAGDASEHCRDGGAEHVLLINGFSPMMKTNDLEDLVRPFSGQGISIRWIDDTSVAAVFRTPALARQALAGIHDPRFKVHKYAEATAGVDWQFSVTDLEPPAPRPATSARVAQRMIAGALSRQGISSQNLRAKARGNAQQMLQQEAERKQRLTKRQQMRDEAWGED